MKHTRRQWLVGTAGGAMAAAQAVNRPNILLVLSDDHSVPYVGCYGSGTKTPNLEAFAHSGMIFDRMFTVAPQCVPSRAGF